MPSTGSERSSGLIPRNANHGGTPKIALECSLRLFLFSALFLLPLFPLRSQVISGYAGVFIVMHCMAVDSTVNYLLHTQHVTTL